MCDADYLGPKDTYNTSVIDPDSEPDMRGLFDFLSSSHDQFYMDKMAVPAFTNKFIECNFKDDDYYRKIFEQAQEFADIVSNREDPKRYGWTNTVNEQDFVDYLKTLDPQKTKSITDKYCDINCANKSFSLKSPGGQKSIEQLFGSINNLQNFCNENVSYDSCPVDCKMSEWTPWSECADGIQSRSRTITTQPLNNGAPCGELSQEQTCDMPETAPDSGTAPDTGTTPDPEPDQPKTNYGGIALIVLFVLGLFGGLFFILK